MHPRLVTMATAIHILRSLMNSMHNELCASRLCGDLVVRRSEQISGLCGAQHIPSFLDNSGLRTNLVIVLTQPGGVKLKVPLILPAHLIHPASSAFPAYSGRLYARTPVEPFDAISGDVAVW